MPRRMALLLLAALAARAQAEETRTLAPGAAHELLGRAVLIEAAEKPPQEIGRIVDMLVDAEGQPVGVVLDVGGFLGMGNRKVAVTWNTLRFSATKDGMAVILNLPADRIRAAPDYKGPAKPVQAVGP